MFVFEEVEVREVRSRLSTSRQEVEILPLFDFSNSLFVFELEKSTFSRIWVAEISRIVDAVRLGA